MYINKIKVTLKYNKLGSLICELCKLRENMSKYYMYKGNFRNIGIITILFWLWVNSNVKF